MPLGQLKEHRQARHQRLGTNLPPLSLQLIFETVGPNPFVWLEHILLHYNDRRVRERSPLNTGNSTSLEYCFDDLGLTAWDAFHSTAQTNFMSKYIAIITTFRISLCLVLTIPILQLDQYSLKMRQGHTEQAFFSIFTSWVNWHYLLISHVNGYESHWSCIGWYRSKNH